MYFRMGVHVPPEFGGERASGPCQLIISALSNHHKTRNNFLRDYPWPSTLEVFRHALLLELSGVEIYSSSCQSLRVWNLDSLPPS